MNIFVVSAEYSLTVISRLLTIAQLLLLFLIASILLRDTKIATHAVLAYAIGCVILALGILLNLPIISDEAFENSNDRVNLLELDANSIASLVSLAVVFLIGLCLTAFIRKLAVKVSLVLLTVPLFLLTLKTGSRGGFVALMVGLLVFSVPIRNLTKTIRAVFLAGLTIVSATLAVMNSPSMSERFDAAFEGHLSGREGIFLVAFGMFQEKPFFGWHPIEMWHELGRRTNGPGKTRDAHNLFLHLLLEVGIIGALPFIIGLCVCGRAAWRARHGPFGWLPLAALVVTLVVNIGVTEIARKHFWLILAFSTAVALPQSTRHNRSAFGSATRRLPRLR
jgi:O-antigen ligase